MWFIFCVFEHDSLSCNLWPTDYPFIYSAQAGPITCGKPILRSTVPSLCTIHFQKAQKHVTRALKKAGLNVTSSSKLAPKFHVIVAEYVRQIQAKRRAAQRANTSEVVVKEETMSWVSIASDCKSEIVAWVHEFVGTRQTWGRMVQNRYFNTVQTCELFRSILVPSYSLDWFCCACCVSNFFYFRTWLLE